MVSVGSAFLYFNVSAGLGFLDAELDERETLAGHGDVPRGVPGICGLLELLAMLNFRPSSLGYMDKNIPSVGSKAVPGVGGVPLGELEANFWLKESSRCRCSCLQVRKMVIRFVKIVRDKMR